MNFKSYSVLSLLLLQIVSVQVLANEQPILVQGSIQLTFEDVDGFAYKIPDNKRAGFFQSAQRIDKTLYNILNMKHVVKYGHEKGVIPIKEINDSVSYHLISKNVEQNDLNNNVLQDTKFEKLKAYLTLEESYKFMLAHVKDSINSEELIELAKEEYTINKQGYFRRENRDIDYIAVLYDDTNKDSQKLVAQRLKDELLKNNLNFKLLSKKYSQQKDFVFTLGLKEYKFDNQYLSFSQFVFEPKESGLIGQLLDANNRYIIATINNITESKYLEFKNVQNEILEDLTKNKSQRKFRNLVSQLTQDTVEINQEALISLKTRYN